MIELFALGVNFTSWIESSSSVVGLLIIGCIVFAESGILAGFFLPGDTLLLSAGYFAAIGKLPLLPLLLVVVVAAIVGDNVGYQIGRRTGHRLFRRKESTWFHPDQLARAERFYESHGGKTVVLARFVPVVRTFAPVVAGAGKMPYRRFMVFNFLGAFLWGIGVTLLGYFLGKWLGEKVADIEKYMLMAVAVASILTFGPAIYHIVKANIKKRSRKTAEDILESGEEV